jgi:hypothetical protein
MVEVLVWVAAFILVALPPQMSRSWHNTSASKKMDVLVCGALLILVAIAAILDQPDYRVHVKRLVDDGSLYILYQMRQLKRLAHDWREELCFLPLGVVGVLCIICLMRHFVRLARDDELWLQHKARERRVAIAALRVEAEELARDARREAALRVALRLMRSTEDIPASNDGANSCIVCMERPSDVAVVPCGHFCLCEECAAKCNNCPICRGPKGSLLKIFMGS